MAATTGAQVTAINVSPEQLRVSRQRAEEAGVSTSWSSANSTTALLEGQFDRVVSVGMMEHVGVAPFRRVFRQDPRVC